MVPYGYGMQIGPNNGFSDASLIPPPLKVGDRVAVIAPGSPVDSELLRDGIAVLTSWGLQVDVLPHVADTVFAPFTHLAGSDQARRDDFVEAMTRPGISAVFSARGGTGAGRTLEAITGNDWRAIGRCTPRWFVGSSDATAIHAAIAQRLNWVTLFGPMPATSVFVDPAEKLSAQRLHDALFDTSQTETIHAQTIHGTPVIFGAPVTAPMVGGTITVLASLVGSGDLPTARGRLVLLEDIGEAPRRLDRSLTQLRRSGWFDGALGVVIGSLLDCGADPLEIVRQRVADLNVPVAANFAIGHGSPQFSVPLGQKITFDPEAATLTIVR
jgi:muramoyltetrapeptide carboxypeptidase